MRIFVKILLVLCSCDVLAQHDWDSIDWDNASVGFGCSVGGEMTIPVIKMTEFLVDRQFDEIRASLNSDLPADQYLAVVLMEKLSSKREIELTDKERERIGAIRNSEQNVPVCSGCTYWKEVSLRDLFSLKSERVISVSADHWFKNYYKIYYKKNKNR
jgi:hypothetical protein